MKHILALLGDLWLGCGLVGALVGFVAPFIGAGYLIWRWW